MPHETRRLKFRLDQLSRQQKATLKWLFNQTLRIVIFLVIVGLIVALVLVWSSLPPNVVFLFLLILGCFMLTFLPVILLRWINPPWSAFMWQVRASLRRAGEDDTIEYRWVDYNNITPVMCLAAIAVEDPDFPVHTGFAVKRMFQVWRENRAGKTLQGASTITQQLAKNMFLPPARTYFRKVVEAYITVLLEFILSKRRILEIYLNIVQFDKTVFGIGAASQHFYNKLATELTTEEASLLAAVLPNPIIYRVDNRSDAVHKRQGFILERMQELGLDYLKLIN